MYLSFSSTPVSSTNYSAKFPSIPPGSYGRVFILTDYAFRFGLRATPENLVDPLHDRWGAIIPDYYENDAEGATNQLVIENGEYIDYYPVMNAERGLAMWKGFRYENLAWPAGTTCDRTGAEPSLAGPVPVEILQ